MWVFGFFWSSLWVYRTGVIVYLCGSYMCLCKSVCRAAVIWEDLLVSVSLWVSTCPPTYCTANILKCTSIHKLLSSLCFIFSMTVKCASVSSRSLAELTIVWMKFADCPWLCNYSLKLWCRDLHRRQIVLWAVRLLDAENKGSVMSRSRPSRKGKLCVSVLIEYELLVVVTAVAGAAVGGSCSLLSIAQVLAPFKA